MTKKKKKTNEKDLLDKHAEKVFNAVTKAIDEHRKNYNTPNYLIEYLALRHLTDQYENYINDIVEVGSSAGGRPDVAFT